MRDAAVRQGEQEGRIEPDGLVIVGDRAVRIPFGEPGEPAIVEGHGQPRIDPDGLVAIGDGPIEVALGAVGVAAAGERKGVVRVEANGLVVVGDRAVVVALVVAGIGAAHECERVARIDPDGLVEIRQSAVAVAVLPVGEAAVVKRNGQVPARLRAAVDERAAAPGHHIRRERPVLVRALDLIDRQLRVCRRNRHLAEDDERPDDQYVTEWRPAPAREHGVPLVRPAATLAQPGIWDRAAGRYFIIAPTLSTIAFGVA